MTVPGQSEHSEWGGYLLSPTLWVMSLPREVSQTRKVTRKPGEPGALCRREGAFYLKVSWVNM